MYPLHEQFGKALRSLRWLPAFWGQRVTRRLPVTGPLHLIIAVADHFEPAIVPGARHGTYAPADEQERRVEHWCRIYPEIADAWRDAEGRPFQHTYFYPAEQYDKALVDRLAEHCRAGWGEVEIHLHHGVDAQDTAENTRKSITEFRDALVRHGCLSRWNGQGTPRYAFVHGNWALANSAGGRNCGVDDEMQILSETGCYADLTLPSAPDPAQTAKINSLYECRFPLDLPAPHRRGRDLRRGRPPRTFPLIIQGPLAARWPVGARGVLAPRIENGELTTHKPPTLERFRLWRAIAIRVGGRPDWIFIKLHCHGMDPRDEPAMLGPLAREFLGGLLAETSRTGDRVHFVSAREMVNIALAACDGLDGAPGDYRDYRLRLIASA